MPGKRMIRAITKLPGQSAQVTSKEWTLSEMQAFVGGNIQAVSFATYSLYCDEAALHRTPIPAQNVHLRKYGMIRGPILLLGADANGNNAPIHEDDIPTLIKVLS